MLDIDARRTSGMRMLITGSRFLWVDLQIKEICTVVEEDGTPDRIPKLLMSLPKTIKEIYSFGLRRLSGSGDKFEQARKAFQWIAFARRPLTISEIEEAITITIDQKSWEAPPIKLTLSRLCKICANLVDFDRSNGTVSLTYHTVFDFLLRSSEIASVADVCTTDLVIWHHDLGFVDFRKSLARTTDTRNLENLNRTINLISTLSKSPRLSAAIQRVGNCHRTPFDLVDSMRKEISTRQLARLNPSFQLLQYCRAFWHDHSRYIFASR